MAVGKSAQHTPTKHSGFYSFMSKEAGACIGMARRGDGNLTETYWIDHNAGDGEIAHGTEWHRACSPGILVHHQKFQLVPSTTVLYEKKPQTYLRLVNNLSWHLEDEFGLERSENEDETWWYGRSPETGADMMVIARCGDSLLAEIPGWLSSTSAVVSLNDPNGSIGWSVRATFAKELKAQGVWRYRMFAALGFNAAGQKRADLGKRALSYGHFDAVTDALPQYRDLVLVVTAGSHQWAYLVETPNKWNVDGFSGARQISYRNNATEFYSELDRLVLTNDELSARQQPGLFD